MICFFMIASARFRSNTEAGTPVTTAWLRMVQRTGEAAKLPFQIHPHMFGTQPPTNSPTKARTLDRWRHRNLQSTARYTALAPDRFKGFWKD
jgi:hypothetical protein